VTKPPTYPKPIERVGRLHGKVAAFSGRASGRTPKGGFRSISVCLSHRETAIVFGSFDLTRPLRDVVGHRKELIPMIVEQMMVVPKVRTAHMPVKDLSLDLQRKHGRQ
jgi:hypothetical protein